MKQNAKANQFPNLHEKIAAYAYLSEEQRSVLAREVEEYYLPQTDQDEWELFWKQRLFYSSESIEEIIAELKGKAPGRN